MRFGKKHALLALVAPTLLGLAVRAAWVASSLETGWASLVLCWRDATLGWLVGDYRPLDQREPTEQADFWLRQTERVLAAHPQDPEIAMGAALVLDTPSTGFVFRYRKTRQLAPGLNFPDLDRDAIERALETFHEKTDQRCLRLAARATELEEENPRWRRLQALLQFRNDLLSTDRSPRSPEWSEVLQRCARYDPENALYDYLAASHLWEESAELEWEADAPKLQVIDAEQFSLGVKRFEEGLRKRDFELRCEEASLVAEFLGHATKAYPSDRLAVTRSRGGILQKIQLVRGLSRWQQARAKAESKDGNAVGAFELARQYLGVVEQYHRCQQQPGLESFEYYPLLLAYAALRGVVGAHPGVVSDREREEIEAHYLASHVDCKVWLAALRTVEAQRGTGKSSAYYFIILFVWAAAQPAAVLLVVVAGAGWLAAKCLGKSMPKEKVRLGAWRHAIAWLVGYGLTFVVLGLAPAEVIPHEAQAWLAGLAAGSVVAGLAAWLIWLARRRRFQFSLRALFVLTLAVALLCALFVIVGVDVPDFEGLPARLHVPARGWEPFDPETLDRQITRQHGVGTWVVFQWAAYEGTYVSVAISLALVALWQLIRLRRAGSRGEGGRRQAEWRARWAATIRCVAGSAVAMLVCCLVLHLALTPYLLRATDAVYQQQMAYARDPQANWASVQREFDRMRADAEWMTEMQAQAERELATERVEQASRRAGAQPQDETDTIWQEAAGDESSER